MGPGCGWGGASSRSRPRGWILGSPTILEAGGREGKEAGGAATGRSRWPLRGLRYRRRRGDGAAAGGRPRVPRLRLPQPRRLCQPPPAVSRARGLSQSPARGAEGARPGPASGGELCPVTSLVGGRVAPVRAGGAAAGRPCACPGSSRPVPASSGGGGSVCRPLPVACGASAPSRGVKAPQPAGGARPARGGGDVCTVLFPGR